MKFRLIARHLGLLLLVLGGCMLVATLAELLGFGRDGPNVEPVAEAFGAGLATCASLGGGLLFLGRRTATQRQARAAARSRGERYAGPQLTRRDAMAMVAAGWVLGAGVAALPFFSWAWLHTDEVVPAVSAGPDAPAPEEAAGTPVTPAGKVVQAAGFDHPFRSFAACYFEAMSGMTTTGASVLGTAPHDIESLPSGLLLWRSLIQWLGGLGIVVLFVAVLPLLGVGGKTLVQFETTGPVKQGVRPRIADAARELWLIYLGLSAACCGLLVWPGGLSLFDAVNHTFTALATGGFSTRNASAGAYDSVPVDLVLVLFMLLAGVNFGLYHQAINGRWRAVLQDAELRTYLLIVLAATLVIAAMLVGSELTLTTGQPREAGVLESLRHSLFQVVSVMTTTGYATADFDQWGFVPKAILVGLMFVGGCASSTGGGIKVVRILTVFKVFGATLEKVYRPTVVRTVKIGGAPLSEGVKESVLIFVLTMIGLFVAGALVLRLLEPDQLTVVGAATASAATLMNIGPGLQAVGPMNNFGFFGSDSLIVMSLLMALGRLEVFALLVVLTPRFWRNTT
ncbi:TrkH family potassium uptake protein [Phycisphaera mikurensis]|uniref:Trk system potassium uptake protein TrkH n=1 Tax=Phycisphaera mikurensis (strain NBRC 102666 / KCTC 22515 / FYK2301M01) TaxID=1142394 RepID=I0IED9_PHYMF|nr:TrkH family potassium uptake protein [Phycisphaera mikurensis]MBB6441427.1 trk system potassium uptake protein TrkH [Phycisphaera mikurensis]BAM03627.1 Trk system potassium uptake protein TrkH [Phycisphaera mikurensis NBRC 102666]